MGENRYIRFRCPLCVIKGIESVSPVCDQQEDVRRHKPREWWITHLEQSHPYPPPIIERPDSVSHLGGNDAGYVCPQCGPDSRGSERHTWYRHTFAGLFDGEAFPGDAEDSGRITP